jgi:hypothetical protein
MRPSFHSIPKLSYEPNSQQQLPLQLPLPWALNANTAQLWTARWAAMRFVPAVALEREMLWNGVLARCSCPDVAQAIGSFRVTLHSAYVGLRR